YPLRHAFPTRRSSDLLPEIVCDEWDDIYIHSDEALEKGRAGVAIASRLKPLENRTGLADGTNDSGRWVEADFQAPDGSTVSVARSEEHTSELQSRFVL